MRMKLDVRFSGRRTLSANLSTAMANAGWETMSFDYNTGWDFTQASHRREFLQLLDATCSEFVWMAPPCTLWSNLQNLTPMTPQRQVALQADRDFEENTHLNMCKRAFQKQQREGRHAGLEQPKNPFVYDQQHDFCFEHNRSVQRFDDIDISVGAVQLCLIH